jgi:hypothetical protein
MGMINIASAYLALGDKSACYKLLEESLAEGGGNAWLLTVGYFKPIQFEPRFIDIANRTGLLKYNPTTKQFEPNN